MNIINLKGSHSSSSSVYLYSLPIYCFAILANRVAPPVGRGDLWVPRFPVFVEKRIPQNINHRVYQMFHNANSNLMTPSFFCMGNHTIPFY